MGRGGSEFILPLRAATNLSRLEQIEVDGLSHRQISGAVGMKLVAGAARRAFGNEPRLEATRGRIERRAIKIYHTVECPRAPDECVERLALVVLLGKTMCRAGAAQRRNDGGANDPGLRPFCT